MKSKGSSTNNMQLQLQRLYVDDEQNQAADEHHNTAKSNEAGRFRTILPQVLATIVKNLLLVDIGLSIAFPTIVISALTGLSKANNPNETITLTPSQASWLGSITYLFNLMGSALSGWHTEPIGRKKAMIFMNIPHLIAWVMMFYSVRLPEIFIAHILVGLGEGLMEAPVITYIGEISETSIRGVLTATSGISTTIGIFTAYLLGSLTEWRTAALCSLTVPLVTMIAVCFIPETPMWLLSKNRDTEELKSLQWLRGWVSPKAVQNEFDGLKRYSEFSSSCAACAKAKEKCNHPPPVFQQKMMELVRKKTLKPFVILVICMTISNFSGMHHLMAYIVQILNSYGSPISPNLATVFVGAGAVCGCLACLLIVKFIGKRRIFLFSLIGASLTHITLGIYGWMYLPAGYTSFKNQHIAQPPVATSYIPVIMFVVLRFFTAGISMVPFMMLSELFPFKSRSIATGITNAVRFIGAFIATKSFYNLETWLSLQGVMCFYGSFGLISLLIAYVILPETENRTLEDIELHFSDNQRRITDRKIRKNAVAAGLQEARIDCDEIATNGNKLGFRKKSVANDCNN